MPHAIRKKQPGTDIGDLLFHQDNAHAHRTETTAQELKVLRLNQLEYTTYSPDLVPGDFPAVAQSAI